MPAPQPPTDRPSGGRPCPACGAPLLSWRTVATSDPSLPGRFALLRCPGCGTAVTDGPPPRFDDAHDGGSYATRRPRGSGLAGPLLRAFDRQRLRIVARHAARRPSDAAPDGDAPVLLDVGAGRGRFVATAADAGWDARGLEPSARGVEAARDVYGVPLLRTTVEGADVAPSSVDAATLWHVLEHVDDPAATLRTIAAWLRPGGVLVVGVPNRRSCQARVGGARWFHADVPRHRTHFTPDGLRRVVAAAGLRTVAVHQVLLEHNPFGMWQSALNRATGTTSHLFYVLKRSQRPRPLVLLATVAALPLIPLAALVEAIAGLLGRGGTMALVARRPPGDDDEDGSAVRS
ncbi:MAG: class I SAM-dependent methyltransferase [Solirubrobacteraceae bacterium]|nr:class I SAM-dependent methyltransferase [Solirubrobacteraceae bacterium]